MISVLTSRRSIAWMTPTYTRTASCGWRHSSVSAMGMTSGTPSMDRNWLLVKLLQLLDMLCLIITDRSSLDSLRLSSTPSPVCPVACSLAWAGCMGSDPAEGIISHICPQIGTWGTGLSRLHGLSIRATTSCRDRRSSWSSSVTWSPCSLRSLSRRRPALSTWV